jgi:N utilization substance protein A
MFQRTLKMDDRLAHVLTTSGIVTLEELAYVPIDELLAVKGIQESEAQLFRRRARALGRDGDGEPVDA